MYKKLCLILIGVLFFAPMCFAEPECGEIEVESELNECPHYGFKTTFNECLECHIKPGWEVRKGKQFAQYEYSRPYGAYLYDNDGETVVTVQIVEINDSVIEDVLNYARYLNMKHVIMEIHSPGGSLFDAQRIIGLMDAYKHWGGKITTKVNGFAASAGFYVFMNGDERLVSPTAQLMWHELYTFSFFKISEPSDSEDEARVLRHLQDTVNQWIADRSHLTKDEVDALVKKKELWVNGLQAIDKGFATGLIRS